MTLADLDKLDAQLQPGAVLTCDMACLLRRVLRCVRALFA